MFRITEDPSSGSLVQCLAKIYKNDSIVSVDMDKVGVMEAYSDPLCVLAEDCRECCTQDGWWAQSDITHHNVILV